MARVALTLADCPYRNYPGRDAEVLNRLFSWLCTRWGKRDKGEGLCPDEEAEETLLPSNDSRARTQVPSEWEPSPHLPGPCGPHSLPTWDVPVIMFLMKSRWPGASMMVM